MPTSEQKARVRKLVETLRTTKKRQGRGLLATRGNKTVKYCCLGIACEVAIADGLDLKKRYSANSINYHSGADSASATLPYSVQKWYGFDQFDPYVYLEDGSLSTATDLNDDLKYNFRQIADAFERTYLSDNNHNHNR